MLLSEQIERELQQLVGLTKPVPRIVVLHGDDGITADVEFMAVDSMSCAFREIRLSVPALKNCDFDLLKRWSEALGQRITYLLENIGPLEFDEVNKQVLVRSVAPSGQQGKKQFYEILLQAQTGSLFTLRRFVAEKGQPRRQRVDLQTTHEVLCRLLDDLVDTIPTTP